MRGTATWPKRLNGLGLGDVEVKNRLQTCLDFVKEAEDIHEYVADCIESANTLLTKWFTKKKKSVTDTYTTSATIKERLTGEGGKFQKQLESTSGGSEESAVKIDPVMMNFKEKLQVVKTTKGTMQRLLASAQDLLATVDEHSEQVQLQCEQIHLTVEKLDEFIKRLRKNISKYDTMNAMSDVGNAITEMESLLSEAAAHNEGSTLVFQKLREIWPKTAS